MKKIFIASLLCASLFNSVMSQSNRAGVGNLTYELPPGWTAEPRGNSVVLRPSDALRSRACMVVITTGLEIRGNFQTWAENQWTSVKGTRREVTRQDIPAQADATGMEALAIAATLQIGSTPKQYHLFSAFRHGTSGSILSFVTDGEDYLLKYEAAVKAIAGSIKYPMAAGTTAKGTPSNATPIQTPPVSTPPSPGGESPAAGQSFERFKNKQARSRPRDLPSKLPEPMAMPPGSAELAARILAQTILEGGDQALPAMMRAVLAAGHPIVKRDGTVLFSPPKGTSNGISIFDAEVVFAVDSVVNEITVSWGGVGNVIQMDPSFKGFDILPHWKSELAGMARSPNVANQFCAAFIKAIAAESEGLYTDPADAMSESPVSPIQANLFLFRSFGALYLANEEKALSSIPFLESNKTIRSGPRSDTSELLPFQNMIRPVTMADLRNSIGRDPAAIDIYRALNDLLRRTRGIDVSEARLLGITQWIWTLNYLVVNVEDVARPLVRTKTQGQRGETRTYPVFLYFDIPDEARRHFGEFARANGGNGDLPPNGMLFFDSDLPFRFVLQPLSTRARRLITIKSFEMPQTRGELEPARLVLEGATQLKVLPEKPEEDPKTAEIRFSLEPLVPRTGPRPSRDRPTIWQTIAAELHSTIKFDVPFSVTDWKDTQWKGSIFVHAKGSGSWNSPDMAEQLEWSINRGFYTEFGFNQRVDKGLIRGAVRTNPTARGPRQYKTNGLTSNPPVNLLYSDYIKLRGPVTNCILEIEGEATSIMRANLRNPKGFNEEILTGTHRGTMLQQESTEGVTAIQLWEVPPPVPITEKVEYTETSKGKDKPPNRPPVIKDKVVNLLNRIRFNRAAGPFIINNAVVKETPTGLVVEDEINDDFELELGIKTGSTPQKVHVLIRWKLELVGGTNTGALPSVIDQALTFAGFMRELNKLLSTMPVDESPATVKVSFLDETVGVASCSLANHRISGKLKHQSATPVDTRSKK